MAALILAAALLTGAAPGPADSPRTLIISMDGVGYDVFLRARERGAFAGWPETRPLVSTFPSMTNVAFAAIYTPLGMEPISGYEMQYFDPERNAVVGGGPLGYAARAYAWRDYYQVMTRTTLSAAGYFLHPRKKARATMQKIEKLVLETPQELMVAHFGSTDVMAHLRGNAEVEDILVELAPRIEALQRAHEEKHGRPLRIVMLSDHGNTEQKVHFLGGIRDLLREAGLDVTNRLEKPKDIVAPTYGVVSYGALYTDPHNAETAARAVIAHEGVDLAAWVSGDSRLRVVSADGEAVVRWSHGTHGRGFSYDVAFGDPLRLAEASRRLRAAGRVDPKGYASGDDWLQASALDEYPDAPRRLVDSLTGTYVRNQATVIFSFKQGYAWGTSAARVGAHLFGGNMEGTHGGLDRESSLGFLQTNDDDARLPAALHADQALTAWAGQNGWPTAQSEEIVSALHAAEPCVLVAGFGASPDGPGHDAAGRHTRPGDTAGDAEDARRGALEWNRDRIAPRRSPAP